MKKISEATDLSEIEKKIDNAKTPEELEELEKELNNLSSESESTENKTEQSDIQTDETDNTQSNESNSNNVSSDEISKLKEEINTLKTSLDDLKKEKDVQQQIDFLRKKLENFNVVDNTDLNDSIFQTAKTEINFIKRALRRLSFNGPLELEIEKHWYDSKTKSFIIEESSTEQNINIEIAKRFGIKLTNQKTKNSILFTFLKEDTDGDDIYGWNFIPKGQSFGVKGLLIIND